MPVTVQITQETPDMAATDDETLKKSLEKGDIMTMTHGLAAWRDEIGDCPKICVHRVGFAEINKLALTTTTSMTRTA
jgi:hypothetical protein